mgnify:CR=1 FL=1
MKKEKLEKLLLRNIVVAEERRRISLQSYKEREMILKRVYRRAVVMRNIIKIEKFGISFDIALVPKDQIPGWIFSETGVVFSHLLLKPWILGKTQKELLIFGIREYSLFFPKDIFKYLAFHEIGEILSWGNHTLASKLEFAVAEREGKGKWYVSFLKRHCPQKLLTIFSFRRHFLPYLLEKKEKKSFFGKFRKKIFPFRGKIESLEWPMGLLSEIKDLLEINEKVAFLLEKVLLKMKNQLSPETPIPEMIKKIDEFLIEELMIEIYIRGWRDFINPPRIENLIIQIEKEFARLLYKRRDLIGEEKWIREWQEAGMFTSLFAQSRMHYYLKFLKLTSPDLI